MRWMEKPKPRDGDRRAVTRFLWTPTVLYTASSYRETRWLEHCRIEQVYDLRWDTWKDRLWVDDQQLEEESE